MVQKLKNMTALEALALLTNLAEFSLVADQIRFTRPTWLSTGLGRSASLSPNEV